MRYWPSVSSQVRGLRMKEWILGVDAARSRIDKRTTIPMKGVALL
jgi:hypothetical protein